MSIGSRITDIKDTIKNGSFVPKLKARLLRRVSFLESIVVPLDKLSDTLLVTVPVLPSQLVAALKMVDLCEKALAKIKKDLEKDIAAL